MQNPHFASRAFVPGAGPFFHPSFFPRPRFFPFFFLSPFFFPFFRDGQHQHDLYAQHSSKEGENLASLARQYNCPLPILEAMNPHIQNPAALQGAVVNIPRLDNMYCHKMYLEERVEDGSQTAPASVSPANVAPAAASNNWAPHSPYTGY
ncbi:LysM peptidoglycan-binding domain-containing protein [Paenibacillus sp. GCM10012307]|uniref:LysM peptidoglycan-binding domain-containing protein n=1 Tax=Paenibacillus roseus TaxID=2798579 RepID=A0A934MW31_9BACL|nr:LysM peptidoglycan-binding domain-containing protein [Paenibacillus roseus]MBJ6362742.1 LysM peptidoglycan-binding domain-containing protein [Paenibacillus roseus]